MKSKFFAFIMISVFCLFIQSCDKDKECESCQIPEICINGICETRPEYFKLGKTFVTRAGASIGIPNPKSNWCLDTMIMAWPYGVTPINQYTKINLFVKLNSGWLMNTSPVCFATKGTNTYRLASLGVACRDDAGEDYYMIIDCTPSPDSINTTFYLVPFSDHSNFSDSTNITFYNFK